VHQRFHIEQLDPHWLPAAYRPVGINLTAARVVPDSLTLLVDSKQQLGQLTYDIDSQVPTPDTRALLRAPSSSRREFSRDLALPSDFPPEVRALAKRVTAGASGPYEKAVDLVRFFRSPPFTYTLDTNLGDSQSAISDFLLHTHAGFCEQFAASYAALARAVGLPARVAVGYQPGTLGADGLYHVTNRNAHAWPEVYIDGAGWLPFEPTPAFTEPTLGLGTGGPKALLPGSNANSTTSSTTPSSSLTPPTIAANLDPGTLETPTPAPAHHRSMSRVLAAFIVVLGAFVLGVLGFLAVSALTLWQRGRRRRRDADPRRRVLGAWNEALDHLRTAGVPPRPSATSLEFALRYAPAHGAGRAGGTALMELARLQSAAMYAPQPPSETDASHAWEQADTIRAEVRHNVARSTRWRRRLRQVR
jgi:hypothetical protein